MSFFLAVLDFVSKATVMAQASVDCLSVLYIQMIYSGFSETAAGIQVKFCGQLPIHHISRPFLALLDYVSRAHEITIRPSVRDTIISQPNAQISYKFCLLLPLGHPLGHFFNI